MLQDVLRWVYQTVWATTIRETYALFPLIESIHVVAFATVVGSIVFIDLRLIGVASRSRPITALASEVLPLTWGAFVLAVLSGAALFSSNALVYSGNVAFRLKMMLILLAGINMMVFHSITYRDVQRWDRTLPTPRAVRAAGIVSILLWVGAVAYGRLIGFTVR